MKLSEKFIKANGKMCEFDNHVNAPYLRKSFNLDFVPDTAEITICGLGFYELYINGTNITKGPLAPYISNCDDVCYYDNYEISHLLQKGENVIGILLGNGMRNCFGGYIWDFEKAAFRGPVTAALCLEAKSGDNTFELEADESFKTHPSPITFDDLRMGCRYDANLEIPDWCRAGFDDSSWDNAQECDTPKGIKKICTADPIVTTCEISPVDIKKYDRLAFAYMDSNAASPERPDCVRENVYVFDFGVNTAGVTKLKICGKKGQKITIRHGELLQNGRFSINTICFFGRNEYTDFIYTSYAQTDVFVCKGGEEEFVPKFKYDGFRYAYVEGLEDDQVNEETLTYLVMNSDLPQRATFQCSDPVINKLQENCLRSDLANFYYFPTDCPHREKNGWTGDASMSAEQMLINLAAEKSLKEWLFNIAAAQNEAGALPGIVPTGGWGFEWGNGPAWDSVCVSLPYYIYKFTGDTNVIADTATTILRYLDYIMTRRDERGLIAVGLGDWVDPFYFECGISSTPLEVTDSIMVYDIAKKAAHLFNQASMIKEAEKATKIADTMREAIRTHLIDDNLIVKGNHQTAQCFAIATGIFNEDESELAKKNLLDIIHRDGDINTCGMIGLRYMFHVLSDMGESELAYSIITNKSRSCYGYWIEHGATSMWEAFHDMESGHVDSLNHHFLCDISSWFIQDLAGLKPNPRVDDISYFEISPSFIAKLDFAKAEYNSPFGKVSAGWERRGEEIVLNINLPEGTHCDVSLPLGYHLAEGQNTIHFEGKTDASLIIKA